MNWKYIVGLLLVITGVILCALIWFIIIGAPLLLAGIIFIVISPHSVKAKLLGIFLPMLLAIAAGVIFFLAIEFKNRPTPLTILIPETFVGNIRVLNGEDCGITPKKEDGRLVLQIPEGGMLIVRPEIKGLDDDHEYYFVDAAGKRTAVQMIELYAYDTTFGVRSEGNHAIGGPNDEGEIFYNEPFAIDFREFTVFNPKYEISRPGVAVLDSLTLVAVVACRTRKE